MGSELYLLLKAGRHELSGPAELTPDVAMGIVSIRRY